jgi:hypothetical protein
MPEGPPRVLLLAGCWRRKGCVRVAFNTLSQEKRAEVQGAA